MKSAVSAVREAIRHWWIFLISGILFITLSVVILINPGITYLGLTIYFAMIFLLHGIFEIVFSLSNRKKLHSWGWYLAIGILDLIIGFILISNPLFAAAIVSVFIGFWLMFKSISIIARALDLQNHGVEGWGFLLAAGALGIIFSFFVLFNPEIGAGTLVLFTSLAFAVIGLFYIMMGIKLKGAHEWKSPVTKNNVQ
jgi:uncharacterized membrane protein HdeD (DUF308 family)